LDEAKWNWLLKLFKRWPFLAIKSVRTYEGAKAVSSHTGSLTSSNELYEALFRQSGVIIVESVEELFNYGLAFSITDIPKSNRVVILTNAGGPGIKEKLSKILPKFASLKNPVDTTANINPNEYKMALKILDEDSQFDGIIAIVVRAYTMDINEFCDEIIDIYKQIKKPLMICLMGIVEIEEV